MKVERNLIQLRPYKDVKSYKNTFKMNSETLKQDLCARLPYGVKCLVNVDVKDAIGINLRPFKTKDQIKVETRVQFPRWEVLASADISETKPILFPITCLTQEITVNGDTFVPILELFNFTYFKNGYTFGDFFKSGNTIGFYGYWDEKRKRKFRFAFNTERKSFYHTEDHHEPIQNQLELFDMLNKWHINYRLSPDQFIETTNEYA